ncbi:hypothetical protein K1T71_007352 [Dendrolimus kikuchii]|uniref:Uncharacterized protein n=1 Tax=Dendrolimus kikuchii TaxID=765133 RepID=A0ACC1D198_9NEOP|nr:hypothetical protein K1T71_007352 [Dendrolimus kikuchii]
MAKIYITDKFWSIKIRITSNRSVNSMNKYLMTNSYFDMNWARMLVYDLFECRVLYLLRITLSCYVLFICVSVCVRKFSRLETDTNGKVSAACNYSHKTVVFRLMNCYGESGGVIRNVASNSWWLKPSLDYDLQLINNNTHSVEIWVGF